MTQLDVIAVIGPRAPERLRYAKRLAAATGRAFLPATRLRASADPIEEALALAPWLTAGAGAAGGAALGAVIELPAEVAAADVIGAFADPSASTRLTALVCVVDARHLAADLADEEYVTAVHQDGPGHDPQLRYVARAWLAVTQLEHATGIVLAGADRVPAAARDDLVGLLRLLAPAARIHLAGAAAPAPMAVDAVALAPGHDRAGWVRALNGEAIRPAGGAVSAFRYEHERPLHPWRLHLLLEHRFGSGEFGAITRSAGFCRLASRPGVVGQWEQVGAMFDLVPIVDPPEPDDESGLLTVGQDLFVAGFRLDRSALTAALDEAALTDAELLAGPDDWRGYPDPFPDWLVAGDSSA